MEVNGTPTPSGRPGFDEHGGMLIDGMVCAGWFDGQRMHEPYIKRTCDMIAIDDSHLHGPEHKGNGGSRPCFPMIFGGPAQDRRSFCSTSRRQDGG